MIVGLVASGALGVDAAVPMVMGANIGTTVTNTLVSLGHVRQSNEFRRAFAAATVHDFFNVLAVVILLPRRARHRRRSRRSPSGSASGSSGRPGAEWESPIKEWVKEPVGWIEDGLGSGRRQRQRARHADGGRPAWSIVLASLVLITKNMKTLVAERVERSMNAMLGRGGGVVAMVVGLLITVAVQSSSITTSILIPMAGGGCHHAARTPTR